MRIPVLHGVIDRRILVNFRIEPDVLESLLPTPFRPKIVHAFGWAGICLIRLKQIRPRWLPSWLGIRSENAAHRIAVEWDHAGKTQQGYFIRRRDTNSRLNAWAGGHLFPGVHHHARFTVEESGDALAVAMDSDDGRTSLAVRGRVAAELTPSSVFGSLAEASEVARTGSLGYSPGHSPGSFQGMELRCRNWRVDALAVGEVRSSFFEDESIFPKGSITFDHALLMRGIEHEWHGQKDLCCEEQEPTTSEVIEPVIVSR